MRALLALLALAPLSALAGSLNDTGQDSCYNGSSLVPCSAANTGSGAPYPRQDGRFGRDAAATAGQLPKTGAGAAGFDFTPLDTSGNAIPIVGGVPASTPSCVRDNTTGLLWEVKTNNSGLRDKDWTYTWYGGTIGVPDTGPGVGSDSCFDNARCDTDKYATDVNTAGLCSHNTGWRLPTRRELLSIVHHGVFDPAIDTDFFPNTVSTWYWSSDIYPPDPAGAWYVYFSQGSTSVYDQAGGGHVRLVRSGQ